MTARHFSCVLVVAAATVVPGAGVADAQDGPPLTLAAAERMAMERNPTITQAAALVEASRGRARQAGMLPNPVIGYTGEEISGGPIIRGGEHGVFLEQVIPLGGKLRLSRRVFEHETVETERLADAQRLRVLTDVRRLFYQALAAARRVEVREHLASVTTEAVQVSRQLMNVGAADQPDFLEAEIEERQSRLRLDAARDGRDAAWRRLAAGIGDPMLVPSPLAGTLEDGLPRLSYDTARDRLLRDSPELAAAREGVARAETALARARREPAPDLVIRGGPRYNRELLDVTIDAAKPVGWEAAIDVGVTVPIFNRNQGAIAAAGADLGRATDELRRLELSLTSRLAEAFERYLTAIRAADSYRDDILPRAERAYDLYLARFREMGAAYPQVLVAQRTWFQAREEYVDALEQAWMAAVAIEGFLLIDGLQTPAAVAETAAAFEPAR